MKRGYNSATFTDTRTHRYSTTSTRMFIPAASTHPIRNRAGERRKDALRHNSNSRCNCSVVTITQGRMASAGLSRKKENRAGTCCSLYTWTHALIWYFAGNHLVEQHAKAPDINLKVLHERGQLDTTDSCWCQPCCRKLLRLAKALAPYTAQS